MRRNRSVSNCVLVTAASVLSLAVSAVHADILAGFSFENSAPVTAGPISPETGAGTASGHHGAGTVAAFSTPSGNDSVHSYSANSWSGANSTVTSNDYWQFTTNATGFAGISFSFDQTGSATGPADFDIEASTNGFTSGTPVDLGSYKVQLSTWSNTFASSTMNYKFALPSSFDNQGAITIRLFDKDTTSINGGTVAVAGTDRVDNVVITGSSNITGAPTWTGATDGKFSTATNWTVPPTNNSDVVFTGNSNTSATNDSVSTLGTITFDSNAGSFTVGGNAISVFGGVVNNSPNTQTINAPIIVVNDEPFTGSGNTVFNSAVTFTNSAININNTGSITFAGGIIGSTTGALGKVGSGSITLMGTSTIGNTIFNGGTVNFAAGSNTTANTGVFNAFVWDNTTFAGSGALNIVVGASGSNIVPASIQLNAGLIGTSYTGPVSLTGTGALTGGGTGAGEIIVRSVQSPLGTGTLTVNTSGFQLISSASTTGVLANPIVLGGTSKSFVLIAGSTLTTATGPASLTVGPISGIGSLNVEVASTAGTTLLPVAAGGGGNFMLAGSSSYTGDTSFNLGTSGVVKPLADNALPITTNLTFGTSSGFGAKWDLNGHSQLIASLTSGSGAIGQIVDTAAGTGTDTLSINGSSATSFALPISDSGGTRKIALSLATGNTGSLTLSNTVSATGGITVNGGTLTATNTVVGPVTVGAAGAIKVSGGLTSSATVNNGQFTHAAGTSTLGALTGTGSLTVAGGNATVTSMTQNSVLLNSGTLAVAQAATNNTVSVIGMLSSGGGQLDLNNTDMVLTNTDPSTVGVLLGNGYDNGQWDGGNGIISTTAHNLAGSSDPTTLGYAIAGDVGITSFDGVTGIPASAALVKYTYPGDSSLDGKVDLGNDFNLFIQGFLNGGQTWERGDYNYDGQVNMADFQLFVEGFASQGGQLGDLMAVISSDPLLSTAQKAELAAVVPEPTSLGALALISAGLIARRKRRV